MTVRKRGKNWYVDISEQGKPRYVRVIKGARTKHDAEKAEAVIRTRLFKKQFVLEEKPTVLFEKFVNETFLPYSKLNKKSYWHDIGTCRTLCGFFEGKTLQEITPALIEKFKEQRIRVNKPVTVNRAVAILSKILSLAVDSELLDANPCRKVKKFKVSNERVRYLSDDEESRLLAELDDCLWVKNIVIFALHTGMRRGEIFNLQWFDVDLERNVLRIPQSKSGKPRFVPVNPVVRELLEGLPKSSGYVFPSPRTGGRISDVKGQFCPAVDRAKIIDFRFHDLRHTAATRMIEAGADIVTVKEILGHADIRMTARYAHATTEARQRAVAKLAENHKAGDDNATNAKTKKKLAAVNG